MTKCFTFTITLAVALVVILAGCELITEKNPRNQAQVIGKDLIIDEVFTLSPDKYYAYSWIELLNPSTRAIGWLDDKFPATLHTVGDGGTMLRTENDGKDWADIYPGSEDIKDVFFPYSDTAYIVGANGMIKIVHKLSTGFEYLDPLTNPVAGSSITLTAVAGSPISPTGYICGDSGTVLRSTSRGVNWAKQTTNTTRNLKDIYFESFVAVYACGDSGLILKSPRSNVWDKKTVADGFTNVNFKAIAFQAATGAVVGEGGVILVSRNEGLTFLPETSNVTVTLRGIHWNRTYNRAFVVGDEGTILKSTDSMKTWRQLTSGTSASLRGVVFTDSLRGWVVGTEGTILYTDDGGNTWVNQSSGSTSTLNAIQVNPLNIRVRDRLVVEMHAKRNQFFFDPAAPILVGVNPNFDFIVASDTGTVFFDPGLLVDLGVLAEPPPLVNPQGWVIINSDSLRFKDHTNVGPGKPYLQNVSISFTDTSLFRARPVLWDLLDAGEVRLIRIFRKQLNTGEIVGPQSTEVVDLVRWGGYMPDPAVTAPELIYPNNEPAGYIPEWYSLARYVNDVGGDVNTISSKNSFYMADRPIPGWYSQRGK
jgi:photosystem II stability/assembly factor-like uncharacterized protein